MKRMLSIFLALALAFSLAACGDGGEVAENSAEPSATAAGQEATPSSVAAAEEESAGVAPAETAGMPAPPQAAAPGCAAAGI